MRSWESDPHQLSNRTYGFPGSHGPDSQAKGGRVKKELCVAEAVWMRHALDDQSMKTLSDLCEVGQSSLLCRWRNTLSGMLVGRMVIGRLLFVRSMNLPSLA